MTFRVGVDVGGTFTKAVAVDVATGNIVAVSTVPTTHSASEGVSLGVVQALDELNIKDSSKISLVAHSTTQAVNSLLEGDVATVGIIGMATSENASEAKKRTRIGDIELAPGRHLKTHYTFLNTSNQLSDEEIDTAIKELIDKGAKVIVASEAFAVDDPINEHRVMERAKAINVLVTAGHELTGLYGLEIRTISAAVNASILPKMMETASFVKKALDNRKIKAPLLIMRGDGGAMLMEAFGEAPIFTILSGPAASIAGALRYLQVAEGIFIEVGGTSTNVGVILRGKPAMKYVKIMNHPTALRSVDVGVVGVAGGSLLRLKGKRLVDVGPRSAHIAGLVYSVFADPNEFEGAKVEMISPKEDDPAEYVAIKTKSGKMYALTNTCASNALGFVPEGDYAKGNQESARAAFGVLAEQMGTTVEKLASSVLDISSKKVASMVKEIIRDYGINKRKTILIGGGGGASALVPAVSKLMKIDYEVCKNAEVISAIGASLSLIRAEVEHSIINPTAEDVDAVVAEAEEKALSWGASPAKLEVSTEYIASRQALRAIATGSVEMSSKSISADTKEIDKEKARELAGVFFDGGNGNGVKLEAKNDNYWIYSGSGGKKGLLRRSVDSIVVVGKKGSVPLVANDAVLLTGSPEQILEKLPGYVDSYSRKMGFMTFNPEVHLIIGARVIDLTVMGNAKSIIVAAEKELKAAVAKELMVVVSREVDQREINAG